LLYTECNYIESNKFICLHVITNNKYCQGQIPYSLVWPTVLYVGALCRCTENNNLGQWCYTHMYKCYDVITWSCNLHVSFTCHRQSSQCAYTWLWMTHVCHVFDIKYNINTFRFLINFPCILVYVIAQTVLFSEPTQWIKQKHSEHTTLPHL